MTTRYFIISGAVLGIVAAFLAYAGNPANMGICAACFLRDASGALGFHSVQTLQYLRPTHRACARWLFSEPFLDERIRPKELHSDIFELFLGRFCDDRRAGVFGLPVASVFKAWRWRYDGDCWLFRLGCWRWHRAFL